jgi:hypothetical protein
MKGRYDTFVVRIFCEDEGKFKGNVQHLSTRNQIRFNNFEVMDKFILSHTCRDIKTNNETEPQSQTPNKTA